jgi:hypothetical protein
MHRKRPIYLSVLSIPLLSLTLVPQGAAAQSIDCSALLSRYVQAADLLLGASDSGNESPHMRSTRQSASTILASGPLVNVVAVKSTCNSDTYYYSLFAYALLNSSDSEPYATDLFFGLGEWQQLESQIGRYPGLTPGLFRNMLGRIAANMRAKHVALDSADQMTFLARWLPSDAMPDFKASPPP